MCFLDKKKISDNNPVTAECNGSIKLNSCKALAFPRIPLFSYLLTLLTHQIRNLFPLPLHRANLATCCALFTLCDGGCQQIVSSHTKKGKENYIIGFSR